MVNTLLDLGLFLVLHGPLGVVVANLVSTSAGMTFSFVANGLFTFRSERLTMRHAALFLATTGTVMWVVQPAVILGLVALVGDDLIAPVKLASIAVSVVLNYLAYRYVVWPLRPGEAAVRPEPEVTSDPRP